MLWPALRGAPSEVACGWDFLASGGTHKTTPLSFSVVISTSLKVGRCCGVGALQVE